jgi:hypothetical protein
MVGAGFGWFFDSTAIFALPLVRLPDWFIADVARDSHSIGSLISSFVHQPSGSWIELVGMGRMSV